MLKREATTASMLCDVLEMSDADGALCHVLLDGVDHFLSTSRVVVAYRLASTCKSLKESVRGY
eukprot:5267403-Prymnesium_polylepis.1